MKTYAYLVISLALFFVVLGGYGLWYHNLGAVSAEVSRLTTEIAQKSYDATQATAAEKELAKLAAQEERIHNYFIVSADVGPFLQDLQAIGASLGTKVTVASVAAATAPRPHVALSLSISGSFDAVLRTVGMIEYGPHDIQVGTLALNSTVAEEGTTWTASMAFKVGTASSTTSVKVPVKMNVSTSTATSTGTATTTP